MQCQTQDIFYVHLPQYFLNQMLQLQMNTINELDSSFAKNASIYNEDGSFQPYHGYK